jgi:hypothetical protein
MEKLQMHSHLYILKRCTMQPPSMCPRHNFFLDRSIEHLHRSIDEKKGSTSPSEFFFPFSSVASPRFSFPRLWRLRWWALSRHPYPRCSSPRLWKSPASSPLGARPPPALGTSSSSSPPLPRERMMSSRLPLEFSSAHHPYPYLTRL